MTEVKVNYVEALKLLEESAETLLEDIKGIRALISLEKAAEQQSEQPRIVMKVKSYDIICE